VNKNNKKKLPFGSSAERKVEEIGANASSQIVGYARIMSIDRGRDNVVYCFGKGERFVDR